MTAMRDSRFGAVDLGGTKILTAVAREDGLWLGEDLRPSEVEVGPDGVIERIVASLQAACAQAGMELTDIAALGVAAPGPIDFEQGVIIEAPNMPGWVNVPLARRLSELLGRPAVLENDANAAALGEYVYGAGRGVRHMVYLTVSTGVGGGLVLDGRLYRGATGSAGELGHILVDEDGPVCGCGARGCLEAFASGTAIGARGRDAAEKGASPTIARLAGGEDVTAEHVAAAATEGDPVAQSIIATAAHYLGLGLADFVNVFNPDLIVIGGGAANIGPMLLDPAVDLMRARAFAGPAEHVRVVTAALGGRSVVAGALALARGCLEP
jgi:glucokinase